MADETAWRALDEIEHEGQERERACLAIFRQHYLHHRPATAGTRVADVARVHGSDAFRAVMDKRRVPQRGRPSVTGSRLLEGGRSGLVVELRGQLAAYVLARQSAEEHWRLAE